MILILAMALPQVIRLVVPEEEKEVRQGVQDWVKNTFPEADQEASLRYGLKPFRPYAPSNKDRPPVILIHGLDEPGRIWLNLAPGLDAAGFSVWFMSYPNDQAVERSARFFHESLKDWQNNSQAIAIVAHSMGGLVSRQMLTDPAIRYEDCAVQGRCPKVGQLIMVGTPNHGSELARFRFVMELRDQAQALFDQETHWLAGLLDGTGAAGIDLLPGSQFLTRLNARPHPKGVQMVVIAGILSPWTTERTAGLKERLTTTLPDSDPGEVSAFSEALDKVAAGVGDGLVSLDSARLEGIPLVQVQGTHLTMIRNISKTSDRVPPGVPMVLKLLSE